LNLTKGPFGNAVLISTILKIEKAFDKTYLKKKKKKKKDNFTNPLKFGHFLKYPPNFQKFSLTPPELLITLNLDQSVQIRVQNF
jgi:hypothetical protein